MIDTIEKLRTASEHRDGPLTLSWESWTPVLAGKCAPDRIDGDLKTYLTACLFAEPLNLTFSLYSKEQLAAFIEADEFFSLAAAGGYFIIGDRDGDFVCVSLDDQAVALIGGWSITEKLFTKEKQYKSLKTFLRGEIKRAREAIADARESERLRAEFEKASEKNPDAVDEHGYTKFHRALRAGDLPDARRELERGASHDMIGNGCHPLYLAMTGGNLELVELLLARGCDANATAASDGRTIMHRAALGSSVEMLRLLHEHGGDLDRGVGDYDETPMLLALSHNRQDIVAYLLSHGVDPSKYLTEATRCREARTFVPILLQHGADPNTDNGAALIDAVMSRKADLAEQLLAAGADVAHVTGRLPSMVLEPAMREVLQAAGAPVE